MVEIEGLLSACRSNHDLADISHPFGDFLNVIPYLYEFRDVTIIRCYIHLHDRCVMPNFHRFHRWDFSGDIQFHLLTLGHEGHSSWVPSREPYPRDYPDGDGDSHLPEEHCELVSDNHCEPIGDNLATSDVDEVPIDDLCKFIDRNDFLDTTLSFPWVEHSGVSPGKLVEKALDPIILEMKPIPTSPKTAESWTNYTWGLEGRVYFLRIRTRKGISLRKCKGKPEPTSAHQKSLKIFKKESTFSALLDPRRQEGLGSLFFC